MDDTHPKCEEEIYTESIENIVRWLGFKPLRTTYSSDYFDQLYKLAEDLIRKDRAYVCHCTESEIQAQRGLDMTTGAKGKVRYACVHRNRPISESMAEFHAMRDGKYHAHEAALRMKQDLDSNNPQMWDIFAYRIIEDDKNDFCKHIRTGNKWKIYPTYDFTHCLCDSFEGITHSLCTTEFEQSRESYEWLCDELGVYKPMQREYGRLNVSGTILSKRKLIKLVEGEEMTKPNLGKYVRGWDDPRLFTLVGLRRRGIPPGAILSFVSELGVTKAKTTIEIPRFESAVRTYLETLVPRLMLVLDPICVIIDNLPDDYIEMVEIPFSKDASHGSHLVPFTKTVFIDRSDFREAPSKAFYRLSPGESVGLMKVQYPIIATSFELDPITGLVCTIRALYAKPEEDSVLFKKPKAYIHWVGLSPLHNSPLKAEVRTFKPLFNSADPASHPSGFLADINPKSEEVFANALLDIGFNEVKSRAPWPEDPGSCSDDGNEGICEPESVRFQGMRVAYFCEDKKSTAEKLILNRIVSLTEDSSKDK
ncbi:Glutaminyl-tRNA synthetase [Ophidiomyces ophidiicola]|uniref:Glutaminyl-tRNA synthetase n=1 Tax=Ophidiomyces ophidiicola TaxID=1387563 RepID=UPI0020C4CAB9|nr:Glutaminyl-tRNA synthetase [Ophidiomyces ophidiicola]KAI1914534.1 Glutaminyl-tRNA synthetase [Ophidiomyces ophidiicola]KAI1927514.1 Glutaminyl-tRNA synthetase [Ophidiomyces ophidiicola]KAI1950470.1 Glutaminyl-tRNA synthetase [Ophidiomyces ophidiicola]KAI2031992.1 Glutaminyl-tRNA synthetase [Ophidiomyces ophidiicola]KAI2058726.1 Glutaminyl-tRNA synthetase [Ophidiomyces ophidiicola]